MVTNGRRVFAIKVEVGVIGKVDDSGTIGRRLVGNREGIVLHLVGHGHIEIAGIAFLAIGSAIMQGDAVRRMGHNIPDFGIKAS